MATQLVCVQLATKFQHNTTIPAVSAHTVETMSQFQGSEILDDRLVNTPQLRKLAAQRSQRAAPQAPQPPPHPLQRNVICQQIGCLFSPRRIEVGDTRSPGQACRSRRGCGRAWALEAPAGLAGGVAPRADGTVVWQSTGLSPYQQESGVAEHRGL